MRWTQWLLVLWVALGVSSWAQATERLVFDPAATSIVVRVGRGGVFSFAGHDHEVAAPVSGGQIMLDRSDITRSTLTVEFDAAALKVTGKGEPPEDVPEVQRVMRGERVLDVAKYQKIAFSSRKISVTQRSAERSVLRVDGELTLHGATRSLTVPVEVRLTANGLSANGRVSVRQSDFGIRPVTAAGGAVRVKDEVEIVFTITARSQ
jgi:polyisoprenoid-binding protein YceI